MIKRIQSGPTKSRLAPKNSLVFKHKAAQADNDNTKKAVKNIQAKVEKATLGDLGALADLKNKLKNEEEGK